MPLYEYRCHSCRRRVTLLARGANFVAVCPACGSAKLSRLISSFAVLKSPESRYEAMAEPERWQGLDESDPMAMARVAREMKAEMGDELGPEFDEAMDRMEAGEMPDDMGGDVGGGPAGLGEEF